MLAVFLFIALWVVLALGLFLTAMRGGGGVRETVTRARGGQRVFALSMVVIYTGFGVLLPLLFLTGNHSHASAQIGGLKLTANEKAGRELFGEHCGICHTLSAANANGKVGPNLDQIQPSEALVLHTIENGCLQRPTSSEVAQTCLGEGTMPANILQGQQAQQVAAFVGRVAGRE